MGLSLRKIFLAGILAYSVVNSPSKAQSPTSERSSRSDITTVIKDNNPSPVSLETSLPIKIEGSPIVYNEKPMINYYGGSAYSSGNSLTAPASPYREPTYIGLQTRREPTNIDLQTRLEPTYIGLLTRRVLREISASPRKYAEPWVRRRPPSGRRIGRMISSQKAER